MTIDTQQGIKRLFILDPNVSSLSGHYLTYAASVANAARARGLMCRIFGHEKIDKELAAAHGVVPVFPYDIWHKPAGDDFFDPRNLEITNREFFVAACEALTLLEAGPGDVIFYPTLTAGQIAGVADLVDHFAGHFTRHEILLRYQADFYRGNVAAAAFRRLEKAAEREHIRLSSDSHRLAYDLGAHTGLPIHVYPIPHTAAGAADQAAAKKDQALHCVSLGNARGEKGLEEIFGAIRLSAANEWSERLRFTLQVNDPSPDVAASVAAFKADPDARTTLISDTLGIDAYSALLMSADVVLVPYHRDIYEARTSGVFLEASAAGKIVVATADSWMGDLVEAYGNGILIRDRSAGDLCRALHEVVDHCDVLRTKAQAAAGRLLAVHNPDNLLDHLLGLEKASAEPPHRKRAAIFYPWGDLGGRSGAAARTKLLAKFLAEKGRDVTIFALGGDTVSLGDDIKSEAYDAKTWHDHPFSKAIDCEMDKRGKVYAGVHLYYHMWPSADEDFKRRCLRLVRWADEVFVEYSYFASVIGSLATKEGKQIVVTLHDLVSEIMRNIEPYFTITRALEMEALRHSHRIVVSNEPEARICRDAGFSVTVIPHPVDVAAFHALDSETLRLLLGEILGLPTADKHICLFVGSSYGPNRAAASEIRQLAARSFDDPRLSDVIFVIAGAAHETERSENFFALGRIEDVLLEALYQAAAIVLIPLQEGTGASVKTVEALARGACILGTRVGFRGYPVTDGVHCVIEDDLTSYGERLAELVADPRKIAKLKEEAKSFGRNYDFHALFANYRIECDPDQGKPAAPAEPPNFAELLPRIAGSGSAAALAWLIDRLPVETMPPAELAKLAKACRALCLKHELTDHVIDRLSQGKCRNLDDVLTKWALLFEMAGDAASSQAFIDEFMYFFRSDNGHRDLRRHMWAHFNSNSQDFIRWAGRGIKTRLGALPDHEASYVFALVNERFEAPKAEVVADLTRALEGGFDPAWTLYHRGRIRLSENDEDGIADLARTVECGGGAGESARDLLSKAITQAAWRGFFASDYADVLARSEPMLAKGIDTPELHYVVGLTLHSLGQRLNEVREHYDRALLGGFDPGWVLYHRGRLRLSENDEGGVADLTRAIEFGGEPGKLARTLLRQRGGFNLAQLFRWRVFERDPL